jgi:hypothetical protein
VTIVRKPVKDKKSAKIQDRFWGTAAEPVWHGGGV